MGQIIQLAEVAPKTALERINRLTGLDFDRCPESLLCAMEKDDEPEEIEEIDDADYALPSGGALGR
ncbi:MAG: hypothetical protein KBT87_08940 [Gammaproteobacteria bacterium]|jgi:hypothetical protein|nr:hypothetical protein [Gammaproteobacteria bacterium]MBQ0774784.1 hypothetical protein [Gammaproteobacteria bacterium]|tara:strand:+ start:38266 stop:38463 length:198 start_codon:yes stop_codon:yes gene_type:complete